MGAQNQALAAVLGVLAVIGLLGTSFVAAAVLTLSGVDFAPVHYAFSFAWFPHVAGSSLDFSATTLPFIGLGFTDFIALAFAVVSASLAVYLWRRQK